MLDALYPVPWLQEYAGSSCEMKELFFISQELLLSILCESIQCHEALPQTDQVLSDVQIC